MMFSAFEEFSYFQLRCFILFFPQYNHKKDVLFHPQVAHEHFAFNTREISFLLRKAGDTTYLVDGLHVGQSMLLPVLLLNVSEAWGC